MPDIMLFQSNATKEPILKRGTVRAEETAVYQVGSALKDLGKAVLNIENRNQTLKARADMAEVQAEISGWFAERAASGDVENLTEEMRERLDKALSDKTRANGSGFYAQAIDDAKPAFVAANEALVNNPQALRRSIRNGDFADFLGVDEQQRFLAATVERGGTVETDLAVYAELTERADSGENVVAQARAAMLDGRLTIADYDKIRNANPTRRRLIDYIDTNTRPGFVPDIALNARLAETKTAANNWLDENPNASSVEAVQQGRIIIKNFKLNQRANTVIDEAVKNKLLNQFYYASDGSTAAAPTRAGLLEMVANAKRAGKLDKAKISDLKKVAYSLTLDMDREEAKQIGETINGK